MAKEKKEKSQTQKKLEDLATEVLLNLHLGKIDDSLLKEFDGSVTKFLAHIKSLERRRK